MSGTVPAGRLVVPSSPVQGVDGPPGATGPAGAFTGPPTDGRVYGYREPGNWEPVLPLAGRTLGDAAATITNGLNFGSTYATTANIARHLTMWTYSASPEPTGFGVTADGMMTWVAQTFFRVMYRGTTEVAYLTNTSVALHGGFAFDFRGTRFDRLPGEFDILRGGLRTIPMNNNNAGSFVNADILPGNDSVVSFADTHITNETYVGRRGIRYYSNQLSWINWDWDGTHIWIRHNNALAIPIAAACDERLKQDIRPSTFDCLAAIRKVRLYCYRWQDNWDDAVHPIGFVAQRLAEDFPAAVVHGKQERLAGAAYMSNADVNTLLATLCGAVQQLDARARALRERH